MATWNALDNSCIAYLSGGSPVKDAEITYVAPSNDTSVLASPGYVTVTYSNGMPGCVQPDGTTTNYGLIVQIMCNPEATTF
jgi:hypothetical protein